MAKHDLITKDFALYVVHYFASMQTWSKEDILSEIDRTIKEAKAEDAALVAHAHWIGGDLDEDGNGQYWCSNCGVGEKHNPSVPVSYCWNCGAKM